MLADSILQSDIVTETTKMSNRFSSQHKKLIELSRNGGASVKFSSS